jgi:hypothetical protein
MWLPSVRNRIFGFAMLAFTNIAAGGDLSRFDADGNGLLTEPEAISADGALFDRLDVNRTGSLDPAEIDGEIGDQVLRAADVGADGQLDREEYRRTP